MSIKNSVVLYSNLIGKLNDMLNKKELIHATEDAPFVANINGYEMLVNISGEGSTQIWGLFEYSNDKYICIIDRKEQERVRIVILKKDNQNNFTYINKIVVEEQYSGMYSNYNGVSWCYDGKIYTNIRKSYSDTNHICYDIQTNTFSTHDILKKMYSSDTFGLYKNRIVSFSYTKDDLSNTSSSAPQNMYAYIYDMTISNLLGERIKLSSWNSYGSIIDITKEGKVYFSYTYTGAYKEYWCAIYCFDMETLTYSGSQSYGYNGEYWLFGAVYDNKAIFNQRGEIYEADLITKTKKSVSESLKSVAGGRPFDAMVMRKLYKSPEKTFGAARSWIKVMYRNKKCVLDVKYGYLMAIDYSLLKKVCAGTVLGVIYDKDEPNKAYVYMFDTKDNLMYQVFDTWA